jgi:hypothetical protein
MELPVQKCKPDSRETNADQLPGDPGTEHERCHGQTIDNQVSGSKAIEKEVVGDQKSYRDHREDT